jgi:hypothetical protein
MTQFFYDFLSKVYFIELESEFNRLSVKSHKFENQYFGLSQVLPSAKAKRELLIEVIRAFSSEDFVFQPKI